MPQNQNASDKLLSRTELLKEQSAKDDEVCTANVAARSRRERAIAKFLIRERSRARSADESAKQFTAGFMASTLFILPYTTVNGGVVGVTTTVAHVFGLARVDRELVVLPDAERYKLIVRLWTISYFRIVTPSSADPAHTMHTRYQFVVYC